MTVHALTFVGVNANTGRKLLATLIVLAAVWLLRRVARLLVGALVRGRANVTPRFWARQAINLASAVLTVLALLSVWFDNPARLAAAVGLVTAGLAFALQKVVTSVAGYFVILRGDTFSVGDRVIMGGVRGDVVRLGFIKTTIMEIGERSASEKGPPAVWVQGRQYTGRLVIVSNGAVFDEPVYNYSRDFPFLWEEVALPVPFDADRDAVDAMLLDVTTRLTADVTDAATTAMARLQQKYFVPEAVLEPGVFWRITDNYLELTARFLCPADDVRGLKSRLSREILRELDRMGVRVASTSYDIIGLPPVRLQDERTPAG